MRSALPSAPFGRPHHGIARHFFWTVAIGLLCGWVTQASASKAQTGQWSPGNSPVNFRTVHTALLPGGGSYHSRIVLWDSFADMHSGAELGWNTGDAGCDDWPYSLVRLDTLWDPPVHVLYAGHAQLATSRGLLTVGGFDGSLAIGIPDALKLTPGSGASPGTWSARADMRQSRQCPTLTPLRDGRMLVTGGRRYAHEWYFGGRVDGNPPTGGTGDSLSRFGSGTKRVWDPLVKPEALPSSDRPTPREGHTAVRFRRSDLATDIFQALFGGKDASGITTDNFVYLLRREDGGALDADYTYRWSKLGVSEPRPPARSDHVAIDLVGTISQMVIYGGLSQPSGGSATVLGDFWKLSYDAINLVWVWSQVSQTGTGPGPRYGHAAAMYSGKMYVFGGSGTFGAAPTDNHVYEFNFAAGQWRALPTAAGLAPGPRRDHAMVTVATYFSVLMYGGYLSTSASSDTLWKLVPGDSARWSVIATDGSSPGPRMNHTVFYDYDPANRLTIFGGDPPRGSDPSVDSHPFSILPFNPSPATGKATWVQEPAAQHQLSGHTVCGDPLVVLHARIPEIYNPDSDTWTAQTGSGWMPPSELIGQYPVQFLVPGSSIPGGGGRVLRVGQDPKTRYLDLPATGLAGAWHEVATNAISGDTLHPVTGVQYLPGKILVAGNGPEDGDDNPPDYHARKFDATAIGTATWLDADSTRHLKGRPSVTLLVLPNGNVMILGGSGPQIWDPSNGSWTDSTLLDPEGVERGYQSTAMLLPDGRVLTGGGLGGGSTVLKVFCPPYLFNGDNLAPRPTITSAPDSVVYGEPFLIGKSSTDLIGAVCLIRPAAETHGFDQNGRYVPLTFETVADNTKLRASAPLSGSVAPPGDYLLFILNTSGVPAIAKWIHLGKCAHVPCDTESPPQVNDLYVDIVTPTEIWLVWSAPGDDVTPLTGAFDLRIASSPIATEDAYAAATPVPVSAPDENEPAVAQAGWPMNYTKYNLTPCTQYSFALKTLDGSSNWFPLSNEATVTTTCGGGGGGGYSAQAAVGEVGGDGAPLAVAPASASSLQPATGTLVAQTRRVADGAWQVSLHFATEADGLDPAATAITVDRQDASGNRRTLGQFTPKATTSLLGVCSLREGGRVAIPGVERLDQVMSHLRSRSQDYVLTAAKHSRLGSLGDRFVASGGSVDLVPGDVLDLTYEPATETLTDAASWYLLVSRVGNGNPRPFSRLPADEASLPQTFALRQNEPNPSGASTIIRFDLPVASPVRLEVFDLLGRKVATLADGRYPVGYHSRTWDLRDASGSPVRPGVYLYRMVAGDFRARRKMSVLP